MTRAERGGLASMPRVTNHIGVPRITCRARRPTPGRKLELGPLWQLHIFVGSSCGQPSRVARFEMATTLKPGR